MVLFGGNGKTSSSIGTWGSIQRGNEGEDAVVFTWSRVTLE
jgi:hypothetical protein